MDSLIFELQIVFYFQLFLSANVNANAIEKVIAVVILLRLLTRMS